MWGGDKDQHQQKTGDLLPVLLVLWGAPRSSWMLWLTPETLEVFWVEMVKSALKYKSTGITKSQNTSFVLLRVYNLVGCVLESENLWESISSSCNGQE
jgi:hypothetical protein